MDSSTQRRAIHDPASPGQNEAERSAASRARIGAYALHARYDSREITRAGRAAFLSRFERQVDPNGELPPEERLRRAEYAKREYFQRLAYKSAESRRRRKGGGKAA